MSENQVGELSQQICFRLCASRIRDLFALIIHQQEGLVKVHLTFITTFIFYLLVLSTLVSSCFCPKKKKRVRLTTLFHWEPWVVQCSEEWNCQLGSSTKKLLSERPPQKFLSFSSCSWLSHATPLNLLTSFPYLGPPQWRQTSSRCYFFFLLSNLDSSCNDCDWGLQDHVKLEFSHVYYTWHYRTCDMLTSEPFSVY